MLIGPIDMLSHKTVNLELSKKLKLFQTEVDKTTAWLS
jgi:hypothetical protein